MRSNPLASLKIRNARAASQKEGCKVRKGGGRERYTDTDMDMDNVQ